MLLIFHNRHVLHPSKVETETASSVSNQKTHFNNLRPAQSCQTEHTLLNWKERGSSSDFLVGCRLRYVTKNNTQQNEVHSEVPEGVWYSETPIIDNKIGLISL